MPKPPLRQLRTRLEEEEDSIFGRSLIRDELSRISEGSCEGASLASSAYFSAASGSIDRGRPLATAAGALELTRHKRKQTPTDIRSGGRQDNCDRSSCAEGGAASRAREDDELRQAVRAFVETGVRGRLLEAVRRDGRPQPVVFRLSRHVDAFEIAAEGGRSGAQRVDLLEVSNICTGADLRLHEELAQALPPGLDASCAVVDLRDGRCLTLRFAGDDGEAQAFSFVRCMLIFVQEVRRERGGNTLALGRTSSPEVA